MNTHALAGSPIQCLPLKRPGIIPSIILAQTLIIVPLFIQIPVWISLISLLAIGWRMLCHIRLWPLPGKWTRLSFAMLGTAIIIVQHHSLFSKEAGLSLFVVMSSFRLLELKKYRDGINSIFLGFFLLAINFLYSQTLLMAIYSLFVLFWLLLCLIALQKINGLQDWKNVSIDATKTLLYALPFALMMFVFCRARPHISL